MSRADTVRGALSVGALALEAVAAFRGEGKPIEVAMARVGASVLRGAGELYDSIEGGAWTPPTATAIGDIAADLLCEIRPLPDRSEQSTRRKRVARGVAEIAEIVHELVAS